MSAEPHVFNTLARHRTFEDVRSTAAASSYLIGDTTLLALSDGFVNMPADSIGSPEHPTGAHDALADDLGEMMMPIGCFVVPGATTVLIDLGYGPDDYHNLGAMVGGNLLAQLHRQGIGPNDIDVICLSHLHPDHVGWLADITGNPVFPDAQVHFGSADWDYFVTGDQAELPLAPHLKHALQTLADRGRVTLLDGDVAITPQVTRLDAPGHTPGHSIFAVHDGSDRAVLFGDALYCVEQMTEVDWGSVTDVAPALARATRERHLRDLEVNGGLGLGCHFPGLRGGRLLTTPAGA